MGVLKLSLADRLTSGAGWCVRVYLISLFSVGTHSSKARAVLQPTCFRNLEELLLSIL